MTNLKHSHLFNIRITFSFTGLLVSSGGIFEGPCVDEDLGQLFLMTSTGEISPYTEDLLIYFKDSAGNEQLFEFISENAGHRTEQHSSTNLPCPSDPNERKEYKAKTEECYFTIVKPQTRTPGVNFGFNLSVR